MSFFSHLISAYEKVSERFASIVDFQLKGFGSSFGNKENSYFIDAWIRSFSSYRHKIAHRDKFHRVTRITNHKTFTFQTDL